MFSKEELRVLKRLNTPRKIQDFINSLKTNFELKRETCMSPRMVLRTGQAHCIEGAIFAAAALKLQGYKPLLVDLEANKNDYDHVIAVFKKHGHWGAITKTNHSCLRYREPIYRNIRELILSFFHEYFLNSNGKKTLRKYSLPVDLSRFNKLNWETSEEDLWFIPEHLCKVKHHNIMNRAQIMGLRSADDIEKESGKLVGEKDPLGRESLG